MKPIPAGKKTPTFIFPNYIVLLSLCTQYSRLSWKRARKPARNLSIEKNILMLLVCPLCYAPTAGPSEVCSVSNTSISLLGARAGSAVRVSCQVNRACMATTPAANRTYLLVLLTQPLWKPGVIAYETAYFCVDIYSYEGIPSRQNTKCWISGCNCSSIRRRSLLLEPWKLKHRCFSLIVQSMVKCATPAQIPLKKLETNS